MPTLSRLFCYRDQRLPCSVRQYQPAAKHYFSDRSGSSCGAAHEHVNLEIQSPLGLDEFPRLADKPHDIPLKKISMSLRTQRPEKQNILPSTPPVFGTELSSAYGFGLTTLPRGRFAELRAIHVVV